MSHDQLLSALVLLAAIVWLLSAIGWARVFNAKGDDQRLEAIRQIALVMTFACALTAAAAALFVW
jgi:uncharacterized membrane protein YecN with MAPEG domain